MNDEQAYLSASQAPMLNHLIELRARLKQVLWAFLLLCGGCFFFANDLFKLLVWPYQHALGKQVHARLIYTAPHEYFFVQLKLAAFAAFVLTFPILSFHFYRFMAPGLYRRERKVLLPFLILAPLLFMLGALMVYFFVIPTCLKFFYSMSQNRDLHIELLPRVSEYLSLTMSFILAFGLCFQLPLVLVLLHMFDFVSLQTLCAGRRYAIVICFVVAAVLTPPDILSQIMLGVPLVCIYELGIWVIRLRMYRLRHRCNSHRTGEEK